MRVITLTLCVFSTALMLLPVAIQEALYFDRAVLASGQAWSLISGHWIHADIQHLFWNIVGLMVLGSIIEKRSPYLLCCSVAAGIIFVDTLLLSPFSELQRYCGLSGLLNTLLGVVIYCYWQETRSIAVALAAVLCIGKVIVEVYSGQALLTDISWPPYPLSHLAGLIGSPFALSIYYSTASMGSKLYKNNCSRFSHGT
jgi:rhomboid family GlyGly-CTERM serine protease